MTFRLPSSGPWARSLRPSNPEDRARATRQLRLVYRRMPGELIVQLLLGLVLAFLLAGTLAGVSVTGWVCALAVVTALRFVLHRFFLRLHSAQADMTRWWALALAGSTLGGVVWGLLGISHLAQGSIGTLGATLALSSIVTAASVYALASLRSAFPLFTLVVAVPWAVDMFSRSGPEAVVVSLFLTFVACALMLFVAIHRSTMESIEFKTRQLGTEAVTEPASRGEAGARSTPPRVRPVGVASGKVEFELAAGRTSWPVASNKPSAGNSPDKSAEPLRHAAEEKLKPVASQPESQIKGHNPASIRLLLVEDNPDNQLLALHLLQKRGYNVLVANNGREALALVEKHRFDLILMDIQMPEMGGLEATAAIRLRERAGTPRIPIVALTAHALPGDREICLAAGMDDYLTKPINRAKLYSTIETHLTARKR